jgi:hypothetical protein
MVWNDRDINLFTIVNQSGKYHLEAQIRQASDTFFTLKEQPKFFMIFGFYNLAKNVFVWLNDMNTISYDIVKKEHIDIFKTKTTLKKLFQKEVEFEKEYMYVIPYLMEALNKLTNYNVVRFKSDNNYIYALTSIEGIQKTFNLTIFEEALYYYRNYNEINKLEKEIRRGKSRSRDVNNSVVECKENLV